MITVFARGTIKEGCMEEALETYRLLAEETRKEEGCFSYDLYEELGSPNNLTLIEEWESEEHLRLHTLTPHFIHLVAKLKEVEQDEPALIYRKLF